MTKTTCFDVFERCVSAIQAGELIESVSAKDKEFHFRTDRATIGAMAFSRLSRETPSSFQEATKLAK